MNTMIVLAVDSDEQKTALTLKNIVICTYSLADGSLIDGIDIGHHEQFPELRQIEVRTLKSSL